MMRTSLGAVLSIILIILSYQIAFTQIQGYTYLDTKTQKATGAKLIFENVETLAEISVESDADGLFELDLSQSGVYDVTIEHSGDFYYLQQEFSYSLDSTYICNFTLHSATNEIVLELNTLPRKEKNQPSETQLSEHEEEMRKAQAEIDQYKEKTKELVQKVLEAEESRGKGFTLALQPSWGRIIGDDSFSKDAGVGWGLDVYANYPLSSKLNTWFSLGFFNQAYDYRSSILEKEENDHVFFMIPVHVGLRLVVASKGGFAFVLEPNIVVAHYGVADGFLFSGEVVRDDATDTVIRRTNMGVGANIVFEQCVNNISYGLVLGMNHFVGKREDEFPDRYGGNVQSISATLRLGKRF